LSDVKRNIQESRNRGRSVEGGNLARLVIRGKDFVGGRGPMRSEKRASEKDYDKRKSDKCKH